MLSLAGERLEPPFRPPPALPQFPFPTSLSPSLVHCGSLFTFQLTRTGEGREHLIFTIWFREGPEALSHGMVSMEQTLFISVVVGEKGNI